MTLTSFLWFRVIAALVGVGVACVATSQLARGAVNTGSTVNLLMLGVSLAVIAIPWHRDDRHEPPPRHPLGRPR